MLTSKLSVLFLCIAFCLPGFAFAQPPRGPFVVSPQVLPDKKITFRYLAPSAKEVRLSGGQFGASNLSSTGDIPG